MFKRKKRHKHTWSKWADAELEITWWNGKKIPVIGQTRVCEGPTGCGRRECE